MSSTKFPASRRRSISPRITLSGYNPAMASPSLSWPRLGLASAAASLMRWLRAFSSSPMLLCLASHVWLLAGSLAAGFAPAGLFFPILAAVVGSSAFAALACAALPGLDFLASARQSYGKWSGRVPSWIDALREAERAGGARLAWALLPHGAAWIALTAFFSWGVASRLAGIFGPPPTAASVIMGTLGPCAVPASMWAVHNLCRRGSSWSASASNAVNERPEKFGDGLAAREAARQRRQIATAAGPAHAAPKTRARRL